MQRGADGRDLSGPALQKRTSFSLFPLTNGWSLQGKKRKQRKRDADSLSLCSLDINLCSAASIKPNANNLTVTEKGITNNSV
ncbi:rho guanine nucleotide exchange factor 3 isoform X2 [Arapaima gigas]